MKILLFAVLSAFAFPAFGGHSLNISSPQNNETYPSTKTNITLTGTNDPAHGGPGSVVCAGINANFTSQKSWIVEVPLQSGVNQINCSFTKNNKISTDSITLKKNILPVVNFSFNPSSELIAPETISFAASSIDPDGSIALYEWNFGDGSSGSGVSALHTYSGQGTYTVTLKVTDSFGESVEKTVNVLINPNSLPVAAFEANKYTGKAPLRLTFSSSSSDSDLGDAITSHEWTFGDGASASGSNTEHTFVEQGGYTVKLRVQDENEGVSEVSK